MIDLPAAVAGYADRMHRAIGAEHHVASPLGAWLVIALASSGAGDSRFDEVLGCAAKDAQAAARELLANPHPVLRLAAAAWHTVDTDALQAWLDSLGPDVEVGPTPTQAQADAWASEHTGALIDKFPVAVDERTAVVLASAVACAISWREHFHEANAAELTLPRDAGFDTVRQMLRTPDRVARQMLVDSDAGRLAVHAMPSTDTDMLVVSVIADPAVDAADVLAQAHGIAISLALDEPVPGQGSLFDLELGTGHSWTLTEQTTIGKRDDERFASYLPAWSAQSEYALLGMPLGFDEAGAALLALLPPGRYLPDARQVALARYTRTGFEAAAVTAIALQAAMLAQEHEIRIRTATVEFTHPHAVVAVARGDGAWAGVPLFSAWVVRADEVG